MLNNIDIEFLKALRLHLAKHKALSRFKKNVLEEKHIDQNKNVKEVYDQAVKCPNIFNIGKLIKVRDYYNNDSYGLPLDRRTISGCITQITPVFEWDSSPEGFDFWDGILYHEFKHSPKYAKFFESAFSL